MEQQKNNFSKLTSLIIIFFLIIVLVLFFLGLRLINEQKNEEIISSSPKGLSLKKNYEAKAINGELILKKNDDLNYQVVASSNNYDITGFDLLIEAENFTDLELISFSTPLSSFSLYQYKKNNFLIITGVKKINFNEKVIFQETPIVNLTTTKKINLNLRSSWEGYTTKFVDAQSRVLNPKIILK